jgi:programmed cell death protein 5
MIISQAQMGRIGGKLDDAQFKQILESINEQMPRSNSKVNFNRRRALDSDDDDDDYGI